MRATTTDIIIEGLNVQFRVGVGAAERRSPQNVRVDIVLTLFAQPEKDDIRGTIDYATVAAAVRGIAAGGTPRVLLETLAEDIAKSCFGLGNILRAEISLRKPWKIEGCEAVGVRRAFYASQGGMRHG